MSYAGHPYYKRIDSFNVEGNANHPYKLEYIDGKPDWKKYVFYPYDNPVLDTEEKIKEAVRSFPKGSLRDQKVFNKCIEQYNTDHTDAVIDLNDHVVDYKKVLKDLRGSSDAISKSLV